MVTIFKSLSEFAQFFAKNYFNAFATTTLPCIIAHHTDNNYKGLILRRVLCFLTPLLFVSTLFGSTSPCCCNCYYDPLYPKWFVLGYYGKMTNENLGQVLTLNYTLAKDTLYSIEVGKELSPCNLFRKYLQPVISTLDVRANVTVHDDTNGTIFEFNPYFALNWNNFIWCRYLKTTATFGEGVSYVSKIPYIEARDSDDEKRLLNFLLFELAFALPSQPRFEIVARVHHRSGAFGIYHANNTGSTAIGVALRYRF